MPASSCLAKPKDTKWCLTHVPETCLGRFVQDARFPYLAYRKQKSFIHAVPARVSNGLHALWSHWWQVRLGLSFQVNLTSYLANHTFRLSNASLLQRYCRDMPEWPSNASYGGLQTVAATDDLSVTQYKSMVYVVARRQYVQMQRVCV